MRLVVVPPRQLAALMQLMLFVFSSSTSMLPCAHRSASGGPTTQAVHSHQAPAASHQGPHAVPTHKEPTHKEPTHKEPTPPTTDTTCPWVVGCLGLMCIELDAPWRAVESAASDAVPAAVMLQPATSARDVELPPPRA